MTLRKSSSSLKLLYGSFWPILTLLLLLPALKVHAEELIYATGKVLDTAGKPSANALVAVYDDNNKVIDYARTDQNGDYALAIPRRLLHIDKRSKGFFAEVAGTVTHFVSGTAGFLANPIRAGVQVASSSQASSVVDPLTKGGLAVGSAVADKVLFAVSPKEKKPGVQEERKQPGCLVMKVVGEGAGDLVAVNHIYWIQQETLKAGGKQQRSLAAWLDPVHLAPADSEKPSHLGSDYLTFTGMRIEPSIAEQGQTVRIIAKLPTPPDPPVHLIVLARNSRTGQVWELKPTGDDRYETLIAIDKKFPSDDQVISLLAYGAIQSDPGRRQDAEKAIEGAGLWNIKKPFRFDPTLIVSRNRADLILTVLKAGKRPK